MHSYPPAERLDLVEDLHGHRVADPYRWLEDPADPRTGAWSAAQDELARCVLDELPGREVLARRLTELLAAGSVSAPLWRAGRAFHTRRGPGQEHPVLLVTEPDGTERVLVDPIVLDPSGATTVDSWSPSLEGERLAYLVSRGGDEESELFVLDVTTGEVVDGPVQRTKFTPVAWLPGGEELYYVRRLPPHAVPPGETQFHRRVWRHRVGSGEDVLLAAPGMYDDKTNYFGVRVSRDGRWLVVDASPGTAPRDSVWIADLSAPDAEGGGLRAVLRQDDGARCSAWVARDGRLYLLTTLGASRWRLCVTDPARPEPRHWSELIGEQPESVLGAVRWLEPAGAGAPLLVVERTRHAVTELHLHDAATGAHRGEVALPGTGSLTGLGVADVATPSRFGQLWIGWTDFVTPPCVHRFELATGVVELERAAPGAAPVPAVSTRQLSYRSADGTEIRMFVLSGSVLSGSELPGSELSAGGNPDRPRPALLTGYGGFAVSLEPGYSPTALVWAAAGGVWAQPALRGGGEEGEAWHQAGMRGHKTNTFDDFHAAAEALVAAGWTTPEQLAISGGSNGGLLVGAALTRRPQGYRAVVCSAPLLDMVRYERFLLGSTWNDEYGTAEDPTELGWLLSYSPYHRVSPGTAYPAVLFTVFDSDTRVDPLHARKMCAALQHATVSPLRQRPVLLRRETDVGHGARSVSRTVALAVDQTAFLAAQTGLDLTELGVTDLTDLTGGS